MTNNTTILNCFDLTPLADCSSFNAVGIFGCVLLVSSVTVNGLLIWTYLRNKELHTPLNLLQLTLAVLNLLGSFVECFTLIINGFSCRFVLGQIGCTLTGFVMYYVGCTGMYVIVVISFERYYVLLKPPNIRVLSFNICAIGVCISAILSFIWSFMPIVGWSRYTLEGIRVGCSVDWTSHTPLVMSYNITIFIMVFLLPVSGLIFTNYKLISIMKNSSKRMTNNVSDQQQTRKFAKERKLTINTVILVVLFFISWAPYAILAMYEVFSSGASDSVISPVVSTIPSMLAKTSLVWPSLWTIFANKDFKKRVFFFMGKHIVEQSTAHTPATSTARRVNQGKTSMIF